VKMVRNRRNYVFPGIVLMLVFALNACNMPRRGTPTEPPVGYIYTSAAQTVQAQLTQVSQPPAAGGPSATITEAGTPSPQNRTPTTTSAPVTSPTDTKPCNLAEFVKDVTVPDNTEFPPGASFEKTWRLRNVGSCTWTPAYALVFEGQNVFNAPASVQLTTGSVPPGETVDITVTLEAPQEAGKQRQNFKLADPSGGKFGVGDDGSKPFWAQIKVVVADGVVFDFVARALEADWKSGVGDTLDTDLTFGGSDNDPNGSAKIKDEVKLENGSISGKLLLTYPKHAQNGVIAGIFPPHLIQGGDHLIARLGFIANLDGTCWNGEVVFQIAYNEGDTIYSLGEWRKSCDGSLMPVKLDLSGLKGKSIQMIFLVKADGGFDDDWAIWNSPRIER
jgi:hypothetical protein